MSLGKNFNNKDLAVNWHDSSQCFKAASASISLRGEVNSCASRISVTSMPTLSCHESLLLSQLVSRVACVTVPSQKTHPKLSTSIPGATKKGNKN